MEPPNVGDIVRYMGKHGFKAGYFREVTAKGLWLLQVPEHGNRRIEIRPENALAVRPRVDKDDLEI